jgi:hypothetical protein
MDNLPAHGTALELYPPPPNIRFCWLPVNSTSRFQPLDQGIIQSFKAHYRRQWLSHMLEAFNNNQNPMDTVNLHLAIRWILRSWNNLVTNTTIYNCFRKSTLVSTPISLPTSITPPGLSDLYNQVIRAGNMHDFMAISNFLNPVEEEDDTQDKGEELQPDDVLNEILEEHLDQQNTEDNDEEEEQQQEEPILTIQNARQALQALIRFTEGQDALQTEHLRGLERFETVLDALDRNSRIQGTLDGWIT